jgi:hypothetical protein
MADVDFSSVQRLVKMAITSLGKENPALNFQTVHERSTAHRLAVQMEPLFPGWNVDCEYDRDGRLKKELDDVKGCSRQKKTDQILPDVIVHHRGTTQGSNLLVIELKKGAKEDACDRKKLMLLTKPGGGYDYDFGLYLKINGGKFTCIWYKDGKKLEP